MLEVIAVSVEDALAAEAGGAGRIELVSALGEGGLTPSYGLINGVLQAVQIPVNVMIRPHSKSFVYSSYDFAVMREDIGMAKELKANGVVFGLLSDRGIIDEKGLELLIEAAQGLDVTFHKAFDYTENIIEAVNTIKKYPAINRILTAGGKSNIENNLETLKNLVLSAEGQIKILLGGGLTERNVVEIVQATGAPEVHFGTGVRKRNAVEGAVDIDAVQCIVKRLAVK